MIQALLIEDCETDACLVMHLLKNHCRFTHLRDVPPRESERVTASYDMVLTDLTLPSTSGVDTVKYLKEIFPNTSILVLTGVMNQKVHYECLDAGASSIHPKSAFSEESLMLSMHDALQSHAEEVAKHQRSSVSEVLRLLRKITLGLDALKERA